MSGNNQGVIKSACKYDDQQQYTAILESEMVSTPEVFTSRSSTSPYKNDPVKM